MCTHHGLMMVGDSECTMNLTCRADDLTMLRHFQGATILHSSYNSLLSIDADDGDRWRL